MTGKRGFAVARDTGNYLHAQDFSTLTSSPRGVGRGEAPTPRGATLRGWSSAAADDVDDIAVERAMRGEHVPGLTCWERRHAVRRLREQGATYGQIATLLGIHERQVWRDLQRFGLARAGVNARRISTASRRRQVVARLVNAGARRGEIKLLLRVDEAVITRDFCAIGVPGTGRRGSRPLRSRSQLLAIFGHLLSEFEAGAA